MNYGADLPASRGSPETYAGALFSCGSERPRTIAAYPRCSTMGPVWTMWGRFLVSFALAAICGFVSPIPSQARLHHSHIHRLAPHSLFLRSYRCSVLGGPPCFPYETCSSVFRRRPCLPDIVYPMGQELQLTISSSDASASEQTHDKDHSELNTINQVFADLRSCWTPPSRDAGKPGMQLTVRVSFRRDGAPIGSPRVAYISHDASGDVQNEYRSAVDRMFKRCTPLPFSATLGGAIAGHLFAIRIVDDRVF